MSRKTILMSAPLGLGALVLLWAAMAARSEPEAKPVRPVLKPAPVRKAAPTEIAATDPAAPTPVVSAAPAPASTGGGENALIEERIRKMEERLLSLETKRNALAGANQDLEKQVLEKNAEASARVMAEWRVRTWEQLLGLSETQKQALLEMATRWTREDAGKQAGRETWLSREGDLRSRLSAEQSARLHESAVTQSQQMWNQLGRSIGSMVGASKEDQTRFQQTLGDYRPANAMLLPEGYGADWPGMMREGSNRLQPVLSSDQMAKLNRFIQR
jgi:exonuclease VII large subunit